MKERGGCTKRYPFHSFLGAPFRRQPCMDDKQVVSRVYGTLATEEGKDINRRSTERSEETHRRRRRVPCTEVNLDLFIVRHSKRSRLH